MTARETPPFRADHVGSLLRPQNLLAARDAGGWASVTVVDEVYAHADIHDPVFDAALRQVWGEQL